jgi:hypothetical protein
MGAKVIGMQELKSKLRELRSVATIDSISYRATIKSADVLVDLATQRAVALFTPRSGALMRGFARKKITDGMKRGYTVGVRAGGFRSSAQKKAGDDPFYWWFHEFGYYNTAPKPMLSAAWQQYQATAPQDVITQAWRAVYDAAVRAQRKYGNGGKGASMSSLGRG